MVYEALYSWVTYPSAPEEDDRCSPELASNASQDKSVRARLAHCLLGPARHTLDAVIAAFAANARGSPRAAALPVVDVALRLPPPAEHLSDAAPVLVVQPHRHEPPVVIHVLRIARPDDDARDHRLVEYPAARDVRDGGVVLLRHRVELCKQRLKPRPAAALRDDRGVFGLAEGVELESAKRVQMFVWRDD